MNALRSKLFFRYMLSYLVIFFIPFLVMSLFLYEQSVNALKREIDQSNLNKMMQVGEQTGNLIRAMNQIAALITYDKHLTPYMVSHPYTASDAIEKLGIYKSSNATIDEMMLYYHDSPNVYSDRGYYAVDTLLYRVFGASDEQKEHFLRTVRNLKAPAALPADYFASDDNKRPGSVLFLFPIPPHDTNKYGTVMFLVRQSVFSGMIAHALGDFEGSIFMLNADREVIAEAHRDGPLGQLRQAELTGLDLARTGVRETEIGASGRHSVVTVHAPETGWTFVMAAPTNQYASKVFHIPILLLAIAGLLVVTGLLLALFFAARQYRPIGSLMSYMYGTKSRPAGEAGGSVQDTVQQFIRHHDSLREKMSVQQPFVRDQCLLKILGGNLDDPDTVTEMCAMSGVSFPYPYFFVVYISFENAPHHDVKRKGALLKELEARRLPDAVICGVELIHDNAIAAVVNTAHANPACTEAAVQELQRLKDNLELEGVMGVGTVYPAITQAHSSFIEASAAADYKLTSGTDTVLYFKRHSASGDISGWYSNDLHLKLTQSLKKGNRRAALETAGTLLRRIRSLDASIAWLRCCCFDVVNVVFRAAASIAYSDPELEKAIVNFSSIEDLEPKLNAFMEGACRQASLLKEREGQLLGEQIIRYIDKHYKEYAFSLEQLASRFQLSESYTSRFLKEKTGATFLQYLWELRLAEVKRQLVMTDKPIRTIVQEIGYIDVPNFIRKFKKAEGMTPGEYRKRHTNSR
ncbi:AraC family transcriptional regulator [Paenibacillus sp. 32O-W]|uniref:helix-turn-helix domain-containing protein n=1 Tax=Paenibacillus sp. 32O-W TaxID=1695218 RepID=UPI0007214414|nr:helix-turn-helix domain-containing protein [Paenibacillus sp. 32O-W]ALS30023.1 AraC family transcriptional regulator [Paenibacillus sp. 32O-W]